MFLGDADAAGSGNRDGPGLPKSEWPADILDKIGVLLARSEVKK